jgi:hypothetical protein
MLLRIVGLLQSQLAVFPGTSHEGLLDRVDCRAGS